MLDAAKFALIEVASEQLEQQGLTPTDSRICALTGIQRYQVKQLREGEDVQHSMQLSIRVIGRWRRDKQFLTSSGKPRVLSFETDDSEFHRLVRKVATYIHPRSVLLALEQVGAVERTKNGLRLKMGAYVPKGNAVEGISMLGGDFENYVTAVLDNVYWDKRNPPNIHSNTFFDNLSVEDLPKIRGWLSREFYRFHQRVEQFLARFDLDLNPDKEKHGGGKIVVGSFTRTHWK